MSYASNPLGRGSRTVSNNGQMKTPSFEMHVFNYLTNTDIPFPVMPEGISESFKANYSEQNPVGTSRPIVTYTSTSLRTISFTINNLEIDYLL